jgi:hypothetical protein
VRVDIVIVSPVDGLQIKAQLILHLRILHTLLLQPLIALLKHAINGKDKILEWSHLNIILILKHLNPIQNLHPLLLQQMFLYLSEAYFRALLLLYTIEVGLFLLQQLEDVLELVNELFGHFCQGLAMAVTHGLRGGCAREC